jgi:membrane protein YdbS with pleckstrin-like domain
METVTFNQPQTKQCPFCAETIQARAIKCRFCNEFLNTNRAKALQASPASDSQPDNAQKTRDRVLFEGRPSLWAMTGSAIRGLFFLGIAALLILYPLEELSIFQQTEPLALPVVTSPAGDAITAPGPESEITENTAEKASRLALNEQQLLLFRRYRIVAGLGLAMLVILILLMKIARLKTTRYEVSADRIEWSRGLLDRRVDNLDMFRVIDLKLRRSLLDCIVGVGTVTVITTDKSDPEFTFEKIRNPRRLYDIIKKASLEADRRNNAIHLE